MILKFFSVLSIFIWMVTICLTQQIVATDEDSIFLVATLQGLCLTFGVLIITINVRDLGIW